MTHKLGRDCPCFIPNALTEHMREVLDLVDNPGKTRAFGDENLHAKEAAAKIASGETSAQYVAKMRKFCSKSREFGKTEIEGKVHDLRNAAFTQTRQVPAFAPYQATVIPQRAFPQGYYTYPVTVQATSVVSSQQGQAAQPAQQAPALAAQPAQQTPPPATQPIRQVYYPVAAPATNVVSSQQGQAAQPVRQVYYPVAAQPTSVVSSQQGQAAQPVPQFYYPPVQYISSTVAARDLGSTYQTVYPLSMQVASVVTDARYNVRFQPTLASASTASQTAGNDAAAIPAVVGAVAIPGENSAPATVAIPAATTAADTAAGTPVVQQEQPKNAPTFVSYSHFIQPRQSDGGIAQTYQGVHPIATIVYPILQQQPPSQQLVSDAQNVTPVASAVLQTSSPYPKREPVRAYPQPWPQPQYPQPWPQPQYPQPWPQHYPQGGQMPWPQPQYPQGGHMPWPQPQYPHGGQMPWPQPHYPQGGQMPWPQPQAPQQPAPVPKAPAHIERTELGQTPIIHVFNCRDTEDMDNAQPVDVKTAPQDLAKQVTNIISHVANVYKAWAELYKRNGYDGNGAAVKAFLRYGANMFNAFWDSKEMVVGDPSDHYGDDGKPADMTDMSVIMHELGHAMNSYQYEGATGAWEEFKADWNYFIIYHWLNKIEKPVDAPETAWMLGNALIPDDAKGIECMRRVDKPGFAFAMDVQTYALDATTKKPHVNAFIKNANNNIVRGDHGGVHIYSAIPSYVFYLTAMALNEPIYGRLAQVLYAVCSDPKGKKSNATWQELADATVAKARELGHADFAEALTKNWAVVGVTIGASPAPQQQPGYPYPYPQQFIQQAAHPQFGYQPRGVPFTPYNPYNIIKV